jgi:histidinol-phosphate aminotransferase
MIVRTFAQPGEAIGFYEPAFPLYKVLGIIHGVRNLASPLAEPYDRPPDPPSEAKVFFLANPNSPVGFLYPLSLVRDLARKVQGIFIVDEAYVEFSPDNALSLIREMENVIVTRTVSKSYALAGVRLGYAIGRENLVREMFKVKDPFNVNRLTQAVVSAALRTRITRKNTSRVVRPGIGLPASAGPGIPIIPSGELVFPQPPRKEE